MFPLDYFMSCLDSLLGYSTGEFQALQLIVQKLQKVDIKHSPYDIIFGVTVILAMEEMV